MKKLLFGLLVLVFSIGMFISTALAGEKTLQFIWEQNISSDFAGWKVYKSETAGGPYTFLVDIVYETTLTEYTSEQVIVSPDGATTTHYFVLKSIDTSANLSPDSNEAAITIDFEAPDAPFSLTITVVTD